MNKILGTIGSYTILERESTYQPFIAAFNYDEQTDTWAQGTYFCTFKDACTYAIDRNMLKISYARLSDIATNSLNYMDEIDCLDEFFENFNISLSENEIQYFFS